MARHHGQRPAGGGLGRDHAERLRERARHDHRLGGGDQVGQLVVLEPPDPRDALRERGGGPRVGVLRPRGRPGRPAAAPAAPRARRGCPGPRRGPRARDRPPAASRPSRKPPNPTTTSRASGTRASTSGHAASSSSTPLEAISLPTKTTRRSRSGSRPASASAAAPVSRANEEPAVPARAARTRSASAPRPGPRRLRLARAELLDVDAGRPEPGAPLEPGIVHRRPQALGGVPRTDQYAARPRQALAGVREEARMRLDRVLERRAVDLGRVGDVEPREPARDDDRAHHEVVGERDVGPRALRDLADGGDVALQVVVQLGVGELGERPGLDAVVAIGDVDRQQAADVRAVDRRADGLGARLDRQRAAVPVAGGVDPVLLEGLAVLAQQVDLVPGALERRRQPRVVDVRAGAAQQVAVEDQDAHRPDPSRRRC